ncbi:cysteine hydrolase [Streptococcus saliviloxodontae]|uniref:Nicotinamidase-related amidase n=1 Tax=Streptococcus saliviloxodontae TaxID=1349416 RepID=A0ABS2PIL7_9STRE|nr:cysteine hydrolase [Streptococcus saliviloxodontae]MBM7635273.1 nicotinamidase-related amidase [Streptococcus saliviloxodontae]
MLNNKNVAIVITDPQVEFLKPAGKGFGATQETLEKVNTIENLINLFAVAKQGGFKRFISAHYFYPHDKKWQFKAAGETMMIDNQMFWRDSQYEAIPEGSGADIIPEMKELMDDDTIIVNPHKIFGPESNDLALQLRKNGIDTVILAGMNANLCVDSHMRELIELGFNVIVANDAVGAPGEAAYQAALTNYGYIANQSLPTEEVIKLLDK